MDSGSNYCSWDKVVYTIDSGHIQLEVTMKDLDLDLTNEDVVGRIFTELNISNPLIDNPSLYLSLSVRYVIKIVSIPSVSSFISTSGSTSARAGSDASSLFNDDHISYVKSTGKNYFRNCMKRSAH